MNVHYERLSEAIRAIPEAILAVNQSAKATEDLVQEIFRGQDESLVALFNQIEAIRHQKRKELLLQKDDLEFLRGRLIDSASFGSRLLAEGTQAEIVWSYQMMRNHLGALNCELKGAQLTMATDSIIEYEAEDGSELKGIGCIITSGTVSAKNSHVVSDEVPVAKWATFFEVVVANKEGIRVKNLVDPSVMKVEIHGPSKDVKVESYCVPYFLVC